MAIYQSTFTSAASALLCVVNFTPNLSFLEQWDVLQTALRTHLAGVARTMAAIHTDYQLGRLLSHAADQSVCQAETGVRSQHGLMAELGDGLRFGTPVERFDNGAVALHVLLLVSHAVNDGYQQQLAALVDGAEEAPHLVRFGVGVTAR